MILHPHLDNTTRLCTLKDGKSFKNNLTTSQALVSCSNSKRACDSVEYRSFFSCTVASTKNKIDATIQATEPITANANDQPKKLLSCPGNQFFRFAVEAKTMTAITPQTPPNIKIAAFTLMLSMKCF